MARSYGAAIVQTSRGDGDSLPTVGQQPPGCERYKVQHSAVTAGALGVVNHPRREPSSSSLRSAFSRFFSNLIVLPVSHVDNSGSCDPFTNNWTHWPLGNGCWDEVYALSTTLSHNDGDPGLFLPLLAPISCREDLRLYSGQYLNCSGRNHSLKTWKNTLISSTGLFNLMFGLLDDSGDAFLRWRRWMALY